MRGAGHVLGELGNLLCRLPQFPGDVMHGARGAEPSRAGVLHIIGLEPKGTEGGRGGFKATTFASFEWQNYENEESVFLAVQLLWILVFVLSCALSSTQVLRRFVLFFAFLPHPRPAKTRCQGLSCVFRLAADCCSHCFEERPFYFYIVCWNEEFES